VPFAVLAPASQSGNFWIHLHVSKKEGMKGREGKGREGKGREGMGWEGKGREGKKDGGAYFLTKGTIQLRMLNTLQVHIFIIFLDAFCKDDGLSTA
jgi:hypothetical protein